LRAAHKARSGRILGLPQARRPSGHRNNTAARILVQRYDETHRRGGAESSQRLIRLRRDRPGSLEPFARKVQRRLRWMTPDPPDRSDLSDPSDPPDPPAMLQARRRRSQGAPQATPGCAAASWAVSSTRRRGRCRHTRSNVWTAGPRIRAGLQWAGGLLSACPAVDGDAAVRASPPGTGRASACPRRSTSETRAPPASPARRGPEESPQRRGRSRRVAMNRTLFQWVT